MKVIKESNRRKRGWWHGFVIICTSCDKVVELEPGDERLAVVIFHDVVFEMQCECGRFNRIDRPEETL
jgi:hypothetical protein